MRRWFFVSAVLMSLLMGAVATIGVAVVCSVRSWTTQSRNEITEKEPADLVELIPEEWLVRHAPQATDGRIVFMVTAHSGFGLEIMNIIVNEMVAGWDKFGFDHQLYIRRAGWPLYSLSCSAVQHIGSNEVVTGGVPVPVSIRQTPTPKTTNGATLLPLTPMPLGFTLDVLIYAAACFAGVCGMRRFFLVRRARRVACLACGYDRRGLAAESPCPECGKPAA